MAQTDNQASFFQKTLRHKEILNKKRFITCHSYVQPEITYALRIGDKYGFKFNTFTHILEGYKVADKMKAHGSSASTFSDWFMYKTEVQDAIAYNAAIMQKVGLNVVINSDDAEMARRLNQEAAKAVKYGVTSDYVLNLEVVLPTGEIIWTGANVLKNATGYNLTQLIVGSEGTLGIITKIVLKLIPHPTTDLLMLVPFYNSEKACDAVAALFKAGITPSGLEFMERDALLWTKAFLNDESIQIGENHAAHLLIEVDGFNNDVLMEDCSKIMEVLEQFETDEILFAESEAQKNALWRLRRSVGEAVKSNSIYKEEDTVVPRYELPALLSAVKRICLPFCFGASWTLGSVLIGVYFCR